MGGNRSLLFDRENNIYLGGAISATPSHNELYYNEFQIGPNQNNIYIYPQGSTINDVNVKFLAQEL